MVTTAVHRALKALGASDALADPLLGLGEFWMTAIVLLAAGLLIYGVYRLARLVVTLRALSPTPKVARILSRFFASRDYSEDEFLAADGAEGEWIEARRRGLRALSARLQERHQLSNAWGDAVRGSFSDLRFFDANRVPFPFRKVMQERFNLCSVVDKSEGPRLRDLDGNWSLDVSGFYGVNLAGLDQYKEWMEKGAARVKDLGPVLGPLHPIVAENIAILKEISGQDEVSFHMSGTEAVMAAVRLARFNTRSKYIVTFAGAYHGWWDGVTPGLGCERALGDVLVLKDMKPASLAAIRMRKDEIAGVLINPVQCFHPGSPPPNDAVLLTSDVRKTREAFADYGAWLKQLRELCDQAGIPLIFDEVYSGFRLAPGGGQEYFDIKADLVVYGKTLAGGMPNGVVCGRKDLMRRFDPDRPMRLAYVVGTFSAHPYVMGAMNEFLRWVTNPETRERFAQSNERCRAWVIATNKALEARELPVRLTQLETIWTLKFLTPSRYNWLFQYYLRAAGVNLSWVGTGRCLSSMDFGDEEYAELEDKIIEAAEAMKRDGWWLSEQQQPGRDKTMRKKLVSELVGSLIRRPKTVKRFYAEVMQRKHDDHEASHSHPLNQFFHIISSSVFLFCYVMLFIDITVAMVAGLASLFLRQFGHAVIEPVDHDKEKIMLGFNTPNKTILVGLFTLVPVVNFIRAGAFNVETFLALLTPMARQWFLLTVCVVLGRVLYLCLSMSGFLGAVWLVKLLTDPVTDLIAYIPAVGRAVLGKAPAEHEKEEARV